MIDQNVSCKNCGHYFTGKYCNRCGEKVYSQHDKSIAHFFEEAFHFITHFEGTFFTTLRAIFTRPGKLSLDYCNGLRKKYFKPLPFFMMMILLYLLFPFFTGLNMPFLYYLDKGSYASRLTTKHTGINIDSLQDKVETVMAVKNFKSVNGSYVFRARYMDSIISATPPLLKLKEKFTRKSEKTSKVLLLVLLPLTALFLALLSFKKRRYFFDHLVLATEINSFYILLGFFMLPLLVSICYKVIPGVAQQLFTEISVGILAYSVIGVFCAIAFAKFYNDKWWWSIIKAIFVMFAHYYIVQVIYKFILFVVTFYLSA